MSRLLLTLIFSLLVQLPALSQAQQDTSSPPAALVGRLWSPASAHFMPLEALYQRLPEGGWLLIGEQHDNPDHHRLEAEIITALGQRQQLGAVALEMANGDQQPLLDQTLDAALPPTPEALNWSAGWPWALYEAPLQAAFRWSSRVLGADLTPAQIRTAHAEGAPQGELEPAQGDFMAELLFHSHCGQLPRSQLEPMRQVQLARDQQIAAVLRAHSLPGRTGVLLTGSIHARRDLGVPRWLDSTAHLTLLLVAVEPDAVSPEDYLPESFGNLPTTDLVLFTPARKTPDYCAEFSKSQP